MSHYYEHEGESFGPRWMQTELDKHGRYLSEWERGDKLKHSHLTLGREIVSVNSTKWIINKVTKNNVKITSNNSECVTLKLPHNFVTGNFKKLMVR